MPTSQLPAGRDGLRRALVDERDGPLPALLIALTVLAGVVDATSLIRLGHVFVSAMTGNLVFIGLAVAGVKGFSVATSLLALGGFALGALVGARACRAARSHRGLVLRNAVAVKTALAGAVTLSVIIAGENFGTGVRDAVVVMLATSMGCQLFAIRYIKVPDLSTTVLTLTITGALTERGRSWSDPMVMRRALAIVAFVVGAISGAVLVRYVAVAAALSLGFCIILGVGITAHVVSRRPTGWSPPGR